MRKRHGVSVPSASNRFDLFEVGYSIGMSICYCFIEASDLSEDGHTFSRPFLL